MKGQTLRIAILDDDKDITDELNKSLSAIENYTVVGTAKDGKEGVKLILTQSADVALIDITMPRYDGFYVLDELKKRSKKKPVCIMLTAAVGTEVTSMAYERGADYFIMKPYDFDIVRKRIDEVFDRKITEIASAAPPMEDTPEEFASRVLHEIPISQTLNGYGYLKTAILLSIEDNSMLEGVTKRLYPSIGKYNKSDGPQVERAIRHALTLAWEKGGGSNYTRLIGHGNSNDPKPTSKEFISAVVELYGNRRGSQSRSSGSSGVTNIVW